MRAEMGKKRKRPRNWIATDWLGEETEKAVAGLIQRMKQPPDEEMVFAAYQQAVEVSRTKVAKGLARALRRDMPSMLVDEATTRLGFQTRLYETWHEGLDLSRAMIVAATELGIEFDQLHRPQAVRDNDVVFEVVGRLFERGIRVANEILHLLEGGFATAALARWRALHELVVIAMFIRQQGADTAERYQLHARASAVAAAEQYQTFAARLHQDPFSANDMEDMRRDRDVLVKKYDQPCYPRDQGWALTALSRTGCTASEHAANRDVRNHVVNFGQIEAAVELDHYRPYYRMASRGIHADARALYWDLGLGLEDEGLHFYGASNAGLTDPGAATAIHLSLLVMTLLFQRMSLTAITYVALFQRFADDANKAFARAGSQLARRHRRFLKKEARAKRVRRRAAPAHAREATAD